MPCHSMDSLKSCIEIPLESEILTDVVEKAKDFCLMHGKFSSYISYQTNIYIPSSNKYLQLSSTMYSRLRNKHRRKYAY